MSPRFDGWPGTIAGRPRDEVMGDIVKRRLRGDTLRAIGQAYGLSTERIRQIVNKGYAILLHVRDHPVKPQAWIDEEVWNLFFIEREGRAP